MKLAQSVSDYLSWANGIHQSWFIDNDDCGWGPWFRGHQKAHWPLCPKLYRDYCGYAAVKKDEIEEEIREEFIKRAPTLSTSLPDGDEKRAEWEWYFRMQHFGTPTRLLDWTEGALIALYFAVKDNPGFYDAAVWALEPYKLNKRVIGTDEIISPSANGVKLSQREKVKPWLPQRYTRMKGLPESVIAIDLTHVVQRISSQHACFTVHGTDVRAFDRIQDASCLTKIVIPSFNVQTIKKELRLCGVDEATIFPDLEGLSRSISARWTPTGHRAPHEGVFTRMRPSKVAAGGVGVFAVLKIKKGTHLFQYDNEEMLWIENRALPNGPKEIRRLYDDFAVFKNGRHGCPKNFNRLTMSWYLNEPAPDTPANVNCDSETYEFFAARDIKPGEELTVNYPTYSEPPT